jgi:moderate conductance mechanosensitive channel
VIAGFFILSENQFGLGDVIEVAGKAGVVERMTLRVVVLRDLEGAMHIVPNGELKVVTNRTRGWARSVVDVGVPYDVDLDRAIGVIRDEAAQFASDSVWAIQLDGPLEVLGVESLGDSAIVIRTLIKTQPGSQWSAGREFRRRLILRLDREGIQIPLPERRVHLLFEGGADAETLANAVRPGIASR